MEWPRWVYALRARLRSFSAHGHADADLDDEIDFHIAMQTEANLRSGMAPHEAARRARLALGGRVQTRDIVREGRPASMLTTLMHDARYGIRLIRRAPGFAAVTVLTIALGIGANTAIFSVVNGVLLRPLPYPDADRLVRVHLASPSQDIPDGTFSVPELHDWRGRTRAFASIAASASFPEIHVGDGDPAEVQSAYVEGDFFGTLGGSALIGRPLSEDDVRRAVPNVVLGERFWRGRFGASPAVIGRSIVLGARPFTIVGVLPAAFRYPSPDVDVWAPYSVLTEDEIGPRTRSQRMLEVIARVSPQATLEQAAEDSNGIAAQLAREFPDTNKEWNAARLVPLRTSLVGSVDTALFVVLAVVGVILLIACANLANLFLARGTSRAHEMATRAALGAGRMRIVRQLLTESLMLSLVGGAAGVAFAIWGVDALLALSAGTLPRVEDVRIDARVIGFGLTLTVLAAVLFGILPALRAAHADPQARLRSDRGAVGGGGRLRHALVVGEVALALVLVIGAGLMTRSFVELRRVPPGFDPANVLAVTVQFNLQGVAGDIAEHLVQRREQLVERLRALPGVLEAGSIRALPMTGECRDTLIFRKTDGSMGADSASLRAPNCLVSSGYLRTMKIPLLRGEPLPETIAEGAAVPLVISETAARRFWPGQDPLGQIVESNYADRATIVGIVGDVRQEGLAADPPPLVYYHHGSAPRIGTTVVLRTAGDPMSLAGPVRAAIRDLDPNQPIRSITAVEDVMAESIARDRFFTLLFGLFGALALVLAAVGVYGVLAYAVGQRTREIGVRMALGAQVGDVLRMVVGQGMRLVIAGAAIGSVTALIATRVLQSQLHGISATDPATFVLAPAVLAAAALMASYIPARRAARIPSSTALRGE